MALKRLTRQRRAVLEVVRRAHNHPDAAWIYQEVRKVVPKVSLATVYRTLEALVEEGYLVPLTKAGEATRYDANLHPHLHLVCEGCGAIVDLEVDLPDLQALAQEAHPGVEVRGVEVTYRGLCPTCKAALKLMDPLAWLYARQGLFAPGLERIRALLSRLGDPQEAYPVALVGGTNGKGSTARALAAILEEAGLKVGLYTSPHLVEFAERIAVQADPSPRTSFWKPPRRSAPWPRGWGRASLRRLQPWPSSTSPGRGWSSPCWRWAWAAAWTPPTPPSPFCPWSPTLATTTWRSWDPP